MTGMLRRLPTSGSRRQRRTRKCRFRQAGAHLNVLQHGRMSHTLTIRPTEELREWLKETSRKTGIPVGKLVRQQLENARSQGGTQRFLRHAGAIRGGPVDVSSRKGFWRS